MAQPSSARQALFPLGVLMVRMAVLNVQQAIIASMGSRRYAQLVTCPWLARLYAAYHVQLASTAQE
jgi:hypothetical protein